MGILHLYPTQLFLPGACVLSYVEPDRASAIVVVDLAMPSLEDAVAVENAAFPWFVHVLLPGSPSCESTHKAYYVLEHYASEMNCWYGWKNAWSVGNFTL